MHADLFARSYGDARNQFVAAAGTAGLDVHSCPHPLLGRDGEALALDVARLGPPDAHALLIISSGCHGVEGYCGSGLQVALLRDAHFQELARTADVTVLYLHALDPWGFSWWRRFTHENIDLNRNFIPDFHHRPENPGYDELAALLVPQDWPPPPEVEARLQQELQRQGLRALQRAISGGQYAHPEGLFFGGHAPCWSRQALQHVLEDHASRCARLGWIDIHSGQGPCGQAECILAGDGRDGELLDRARSWWGSSLRSTHDGSAVSVEASGAMWTVVAGACPQAGYTGIVLEFGTQPLPQVLQALRADQWLENHPDKPLRTPQAQAIKQQLFDAFFVDTPQWQAAVLDQGVKAAYAALLGLAS